jgi:hypothetical protein
MYCGQCCVMEPRSRAALRLDIFIEILPDVSVGKKLLRCLLNVPRCSGPQPQRDVGRLHRLPHHAYQVVP